jgi:hypothetical protein
LPSQTNVGGYDSHRGEYHGFLLQQLEKCGQTFCAIFMRIRGIAAPHKPYAPSTHEVLEVFFSAS